MEIDGPNEETVLENIGLSTDIFCCNLHLKQRKQSEILGMYYPEKIEKVRMSLKLTKYKPPRRFAPCRIDTDDTLGRSSWVMKASETQQLADATPICYMCGVVREQPSTMTGGTTCNTP